VVVPDQPWLDGFCIAKDVVRQFVAMPLGSGYSVEEQITGKPEHGGLQIIAYPMKREHYQRILARRQAEEEERRRRAEARSGAGVRRECAPIYCDDEAPQARSSQAMGQRVVMPAAAPARAMGLAAGGRMTQQIYADPHGIEAWDTSVSSRCFVTLIDAVQWREITGEPPSTRPPTAEDYSKAGLPWFDYYAADLETLAGAPALTKVKSVAELAAEKGDQVLGPDGDVEPGPVIALGPGTLRGPSGKRVRESHI
jgi:hypothetical protein